MIRRAFRAATALILAATGAMLVAPAAPAQALSANTKPGYYLVLGDGNATGWNPAWGVDQSFKNYSAQLLTHIQTAQPNVQRVNLGCKNETTKTFLYGGGECTYSAGSQYKQAVKFIREHPGQVRFISITVGLEDVHRCINVATQESDQLCVLGAAAQVGANLPVIFSGLRANALFSRIVTSTVPDPFVAAGIFNDEAGLKQAKDSLLPFQMINTGLKTNAALSGVKVADLYKAMDTEDFSLVTTKLGTVPRNADRACAYTWVCNKKHNTVSLLVPSGATLLADLMKPLV